MEAIARPAATIMLLRDGPDGIEAVLREMTRFGWEPVIENGNTIALANDARCSITLEPGGQFELSGAMLPKNPLIVIPQAVIHVQFVAHSVLIVLMLIATFIDFDEQTIPDSITIPGALLGLAYIAFLPIGLPQVVFDPTRM